MVQTGYEWCTIKNNVRTVDINHRTCRKLSEEHERLKAVSDKEESIYIISIKQHGSNRGVKNWENYRCTDLGFIFRKRELSDIKYGSGNDLLNQSRGDEIEEFRGQNA